MVNLKEEKSIRLKIILVTSCKKSFMLSMGIKNRREKNEFVLPGFQKGHKNRKFMSLLSGLYQYCKTTNL